MFRSGNGGRTGVYRTVVVITDGFGNVNTEDTIPAAQACWAAGIRVVAIGMTSAVDRQQLLSISSPPHLIDLNYWITPDYTTLPMILDDVKERLCKPPKPDLPGLHTFDSV
jgi:hypothetical protein